MFFNMIIIIRRLTLLYVAMFVIGRPWISVLSFMLQNVISLSFLLSIKPYATKSDNYLNSFNGLISLLVSYLIVQLSDLKFNPETIEIIGD